MNSLSLHYAPAIALLCGSVLAASSPRAAPLEFRDGDRIVLIGGTFIERMQQHGYLEALLVAAHPDKDLRFRNLGWSGDTVWGESRALFGTQADGFARLLKDVREAQPTVLIVCYGGNEAHAGEAGLARFAEGLNSLLDALEATKARVLLLSPHAYEAGHARLPDPGKYNLALRQYCDVIERTAARRQLGFISLHDLVPMPMQITDEHGRIVSRMTDNGIHLSQLGHWVAAQVIARRLGIGPLPPRTTIDMQAGDAEVEHGRLVRFDKDGTTRVVVQPGRLLPMPPPRGFRDKDDTFDVVRFANLGPGKYQLHMDGEPLFTIPADVGRRPATYTRTAHVNDEPFEELRAAITLKNELYFHRYRPQNETYLFLFRKHEQGNNAVEIPQFDPLIEEQEQRIAKLKQPRQHVYEIQPRN